MENITQTLNGESCELPLPPAPLHQDEGGFVGKDHDTPTPAAPSADLSRHESKKSKALTDKVGLTAGADEIDIDAEVSQIAAHWRGSSTATISAGACLRGLEKARRQQGGPQEFLAGLHDKGVLSENDIKLPHRTSKVSKLIKIGDNEKFLLQEVLRPYLPSGYASIHSCWCCSRLIRAVSREVRRRCSPG